jgi:osmotically inducible protein OsmC
MLVPMKTLYTAEATSEGGRFEARAFSSDGKLDVRIEPPVELGGPEADATNPEQLFAAGYAACFHSAMKTIAGMKKIDLSSSLVHCKVSLGVIEGAGLGLATEIHVELSGVDDETAEKLVLRAERRCPYSNAMRGNVELKLFLNGAELALEAAAPTA